MLISVKPLLFIILFAAEVNCLDLSWKNANYFLSFDTQNTISFKILLSLYVEHHHLIIFNVAFGIWPLSECSVPD